MATKASNTIPSRVGEAVEKHRPTDGPFGALASLAEAFGVGLDAAGCSFSPFKPTGRVQFCLASRATKRALFAKTSVRFF